MQKVLVIKIAPVFYLFFRVRTSIDVFGCIFWVSEFYETRGRTSLDEGSVRRKGLYLLRTTEHINTRDKHPCLQRDSNPRSQQPSGQDLLRLKPRGQRDRHFIYLFIYLFRFPIHQSVYPPTLLQRPSPCVLHVSLISSSLLGSSQQYL
jgi:hypothetical protein